MRLVLVGPPGSGKGTQAALLVKRLGLTYVGTGDILRDAIRRQTPLGRQVEPLIKQGLLVPDTIVNDLEVPYQVAAFYGGTGLLIVISVALDLVQKINSHLVMRNYPGLTDD